MANERKTCPHIAGSIAATSEPLLCVLELRGSTAAVRVSCLDAVAHHARCVCWVQAGKPRRERQQHRQAGGEGREKGDAALDAGSGSAEGKREDVGCEEDRA